MNLEDVIDSGKRFKPTKASCPDWNEFMEVSDGLFSKNIYNYESDVIRELLANAFAHRNYSI